MAATSWNVRQRKDVVDEKKFYKGHDNVFTLEINHGGAFTKLPRKYLNSKLSYVDNVDIDTFSVPELNEMMVELGYFRGDTRFYHFRIPGEGLDWGVRPIATDQDVIILSRYVKEFKVIQVYIEHGQSVFDALYVTPLKVVIPVDDDDPSPEYKTDKNKNVAGCSSRKLNFDLNVSCANDQINDLDQGTGNTMSGVPYHNHSARTNNENTLDKDRSAQVNGSEFRCTQQESPVITQLEGAGEGCSGVKSVTTGEGLQHLNEGRDNQTSQHNQEGLDFFDPIFIFQQHDIAYDGELEDDYEINIDGDVETLAEENLDSENEGEVINEGGGDNDSSSDGDFTLDDQDIIDDVDVDMAEFQSVVDPIIEGLATQGSNVMDTEMAPTDVEVIDRDKFKFCGVEEDRRHVLLKNLRTPRTCSAGEVHEAEFNLGDVFADKKQVKQAIRNLAIETSRDLKIVKNDKVRIRAVCRGSVPQTDGSGPSGLKRRKSKGKSVNSSAQVCPWLLHVSRSKIEDDWMVKTFVDVHKCSRTRSTKICNQTFLANNILQQIEGNPNIPVAALREELQKKFHITLSKMKVFRAKTIAKNILHGDYEKQYSMLRDYVMELQATNPGTTVKIEVETESNNSLLTRQFKRIYICLGPLIEGFKAGKRDLLGLDGAFMKGPFPGQILTAVGIDGNNGIYPVAYAIVEAETRDSWTWFLTCLGDDLDLQTNSNFTFISDRQKGILPAISTVFPSAEHRYCVRHIHENMKKHWRGKALKDHLWRCATATTLPFFGKAMEDLKKLNNQAYEWLKLIPPKHWARSHFTGRAQSDILLNNMCEVFNGKIVDGRDKPIISALEYIREYLMKKIVTVQKLIEKSGGRITPTAQFLLDKIKHEANYCNAIYNGNGKYQVSGEHLDQYVVNMKDKSCTCRKWDLTGLPCKHAVCGIWDMIQHGERVGGPEDWVADCYKLSTWKKMYSFTIDPINGRQMWPKSGCPTTLTPPKHHTQVGRPKNKSIRGQFEEGSQGTKLTRKYLTVTCSKCHNTGHNARSCKGQGVLLLDPHNESQD